MPAGNLNRHFQLPCGVGQTKPVRVIPPSPVAITYESQQKRIEGTVRP
ncbi:hypothetical protein GCM10011491_35230 [Brucella endophytica]|uniref:Uncharacterized protein n=1 Tax=Brucella endophytica TaxID=1963359 RepID=A0A916SK97_9HYPH|nr:hypothetical protein GCM10011491_35230 [Brucella endophytica]